MSASTTRPMSASCSAPTTRCCRTTSGCRSAITAAPPPCVPSGAPVRRPSGQRKRPDETAPELRPLPQPGLRARARGLDRPRQRAGHARSRSGEAAEHVAGYCLLNDWSARDIQAWEYQPLGPVPVQELRHHDLALDRHARGAGAVPHRRSRRGRKATRRRSTTCWTRPTSARAPSTSSSRCCC